MSYVAEELHTPYHVRVRQGTGCGKFLRVVGCVARTARDDGVAWGKSAAVRRLSVGLVGVVAMVLVAGCGGGSGGESPTSATSASPSADLSSTKDLTGVTATVGGSANPYFSHIPDLCPRFPDSALQKLGFTVEPGYKQPFHPQARTRLLQICNIGFDSPDSSGDIFTFSPGLTSEPVNEIIDQAGVRMIDSNVMLGGNRAYLYTKDGADNLCALAWGTFYGSALWSLQVGGVNGKGLNICAKLEEMGQALYQYMPTRPSEMG